MIFDEDEAKKVKDKCCYVTQLDKVSDNNFKQAYFPKNCYVLDNPPVVITQSHPLLKAISKQSKNLWGLSPTTV